MYLRLVGRDRVEPCVTSHRHAQLGETGTVVNDGVGHKDELWGQCGWIRGQEDEACSRREPADLLDDRRVVVERQLLVQDDQIRPVALHLQEGVCHRPGFGRDDETSLLEEEADEPSLERATVGDDRCSWRSPFFH